MCKPVSLPCVDTDEWLCPGGDAPTPPEPGFARESYRYFNSRPVVKFNIVRLPNLKIVWLK